MEDKNIEVTPSPFDVAVEAMGFEPDTTVNLLDEPKTPIDSHSKREWQRHVAIAWEGGVIWLNLFDFVDGYDESETPHYCIDIRQINSAGRVKGQGVFTMSRNTPNRGMIPDFEEEGVDQVKGRDWNGGYLVSILTDPDGKESHTDDEREKK